MQRPVRPIPGAGPSAQSPEEAVLLMAMRIGKRMRLREAGDEADAAALSLLHMLTCTGPLRLSDLAHRMQLDASTVSRHARQLEERGLLVRTDDPDDRRALQELAARFVADLDSAEEPEA